MAVHLLPFLSTLFLLFLPLFSFYGLYMYMYVFLSLQPLLSLRATLF